MFPLLASNNMQFPELRPAAIQDGKASAPLACPPAQSDEHMQDTKDGKVDSLDLLLQR